MPPVWISICPTMTFQALFAHAAAIGYTAFKIKVGHTDFDRDLHRLDLLQGGHPRRSRRSWSTPTRLGRAKEAAMKIEAIRAAGHDLLWVEDPILRHDFAGLRMLRQALPWTQINSGEYLDLSGKRALLMAEGTDILNVHGAGVRCDAHRLAGGRTGHSGLAGQYIP